MKIYKEMSLSEFEFWGGADDRVDYLTEEDFDRLESYLEEIEPAEGWSETAINDMFWFEFDSLVQHLGYEDEEDFDKKRSPYYVDDDDLTDYADEWLRTYIKENADDWRALRVLLEVLLIEDEWDELEERTALEDLDKLSKAEFILNKLNNDEINAFDDLFAENQGNDADVDIPSLEDLRDMAMEERKLGA